MRFIILALFFVLLLNFVSADPPSPYNVEGFVFKDGGAGAPNGVVVRINDTTIQSTTYTQVFAPPIPQLAGAYSASIMSNTGNNLAVYAWNSSSYGVTFGVINSLTTSINVTMNQTRVPEINLSIVYPEDNNNFNTTDPFNISVNITLYGNSGECNVTLSITDESTVNVSEESNLTYRLGFLTLFDNRLINWTMNATNNGVVNISASAHCSPSGPSFETNNTDTIYNISISDTSEPKINLVNPENNTKNKTSQTVYFTYNVSDSNSVDCSLLIDGVVNLTRTNIPIGINQQFNATFLTNDNYNWSVNCTDSSGLTGVSVNYNISIEYLPPNIVVDYLTQNIVLNAGTTKRVFCNFTVTDMDGESTILDVNASLVSDQDTYGQTVDPNTLYVNDSCQLKSFGGNQRVYGCGFDLQYFAVNGTWNCTVVSLDNDGLFGNTTNITTVDPLYAVNVSLTGIDYGDSLGGFLTTKQTENVTNIGNLPIRISVTGYGVFPGDGLSFDCPTVDIPINYTHFAGNGTSGFNEMQQLLVTRQNIARVVVPKQTSIGPAPLNTTWWQVYVPTNVSDTDLCTGSIVFQAEPLTP